MLVRWLWLPAFIFAFGHTAHVATAIESRDYSKILDKDNLEFLKQLQRAKGIGMFVSFRNSSSLQPWTLAAGQEH